MSIQPRFGADVALIDFNRANSHWLNVWVFQDMPQPLQNKSCGLLRNICRTGDFVGRHAILAVAEQP